MTLSLRNHDMLILDVRQPLDLLADSEIIEGAQRISPEDATANPALIPTDKELVVYCTCPSDKTSRAIAQGPRVGWRRM
jgi:rhodanese-related sulfurtransferase